jgi:hypothetical protein
MDHLSHQIKLPYGNHIASVWKSLKDHQYRLAIFNPNKIRFYSVPFTKFPTWLMVKQAIRENLKAAERTAVKALIPAILATYSEGDILSCSWGWEQTNVEFVQVIRKTASRLIVRAISGKLRETQSMAGKLTPDKNAFAGPAFALSIRPFGPNGGHCVKGAYIYDKGKVSSANHWNKTTETEEHYCSWYA